MSKITNLPLAAITAGTLIALAVGPAFAQSKRVSKQLDDLLNLLEPKTIFVTSSVHPGDLEGLAGADQICQDLADSAWSIVPEGEYVALLSTDDVNAVARITPSSGPYIRPDKVPVADNFAALFSLETSDRRLNNPPRIDEQGEVPFGTTRVWTGSFPSGTFDAGENCANWTDDTTGSIGAFGVRNLSDQSWIADSSDFCNVSRRLYCVLR